ncbi:MAG: cellulase family glycosylhydrolase, partial [Defluviitaleaceae bacterium]|nr:cellulase family glycosylhydrolase [Defluviitaleaceae bacterium]
VILSHNIGNTEWEIKTAEFTVPANGVWRLAIGNNTGANLYVADVRLVDLSDPDPDPDPAPEPYEGANILINGDFASSIHNADVTVPGWLNLWDFEWVIDGFAAGVNTIKSQKGEWNVLTQDVELSKDKIYGLSFWAKANEPHSLLTIGTPRPGDASNRGLDLPYAFELGITNTEWKLIKAEVIVPSSGVWRFRICNYTAENLQVADVRLVDITDDLLNIESITVVTPPNKVKFNAGDDLNLDGMVIRVAYSDGTSEDITVSLGTAGFSAAGYDKYLLGVQTLTLTYMGKYVGFDFFFDVEVIESDLDTVGIAQYTHSSKTHYWVGEKDFDFAGTKFFENFSDGGSRVITATASMIDSGAFNKDVPGTYPIHVNYKGFSYTYNATVSERKHFATTAEGRILDPNGNDFIGIGVNVNGNAMWGLPNGRSSTSALQDVDLIADTWQFNIIRAVCTFQCDHPDVTNRHWHYENLDDMVEKFTDKGVVIKIEMHDYTGAYPLLTPGVLNPPRDARPLSLYEFTAAWVDLALRYKDNPYVWFNIMNEPSQGGGGAWVNVWREYFYQLDGRTYPGTGYDNMLDVDIWYYVHNHIIGAMRAAGINNLIVLDENHYGQSGFNPANPFGIGSPCLYWGPALNAAHGNLAYSVHPYGWEDLDRMIAYAEAMEARGLAWMVGEYGASWGHLGTHKSTLNVLTVHKMFGISHMYWDWTNDPMSVVDRSLPGIIGGWGWEIDRRDGVKPGNLSWFGGILWDSTRGVLTLPVPRFVFPVIVNGDFSDGTLNPWWNIGRPLNLVRGGSHDGSDCAELIAGAGYSGQTSDHVNMESGKVYKLSAWGKGTCEVGFAYSAAGVGGEPHPATLMFNSDEWTYLEQYFVIPASYGEILSARIFIWRPDQNASNAFFFDKVDLVVVDDLCGKCEQYPCDCGETAEPCPECNEEPCVCCETCEKYPCVCISIVGYSGAKFVSIIETGKNSRIWTLTFTVNVKFSNGSSVIKTFDAALPGNNANLDGAFKFGADHELAGFTLVYDIKGNGSNIKEFKLI